MRHHGNRGIFYRLGTVPEYQLFDDANLAAAHYTDQTVTIASHNGGDGAVFKINTDGTAFTNLYHFTSGNDGAYAGATLALTGNTLYGSTGFGGSSNNGVIFKVYTDGTGFAVLHDFPATTFGTNTDGAVPYASVVSSGNMLYGAATQGGSSGNGTVFSLSFTPQLTIVPSGTNVILSWPTNVAGFDYTGYTLQSTINLVSPVWITNSPAPVVVNGQITVTNPISSTQQFFLLRQ